MVETDLISIVVTVYNTYSFLDKCISSIINQTYKHIEIILIDDGSTDGSEKLCDKYVLIDKRCVVYHQKNVGVSQARNNGIEVATGSLITFVDSDDYLHPEIVETLYRAILLTRSDVAIAGYLKVRLFGDDDNCIIDNDRGMYNRNRQDYHCYTGKEAALLSFTRTDFVTAWGKLYNIRLFDNIKFPYGMVYEDEYTTNRILHKAKKVVYIDDKLYFYVQREGDNITTKYKDKQKAIHRMIYIENVKYYIDVSDMKMSGVILNRLLHEIINEYRLLCNNGERINLREQYKKIYIEYVNRVRMPLLRHLKLWLFLKNERLYFSVEKIKINKRKI